MHNVTKGYTYLDKPARKATCLFKHAARPQLIPGIKLLKSKKSIPNS